MSRLGLPASTRFLFTPQAPKKAKRRQGGGDGGSSNVFSMFEQSQIQEYKEVSFDSITWSPGSTSITAETRKTPQIHSLLISRIRVKLSGS